MFAALWWPKRSAVFTQLPRDAPASLVAPESRWNTQCQLSCRVTTSTAGEMGCGEKAEGLQQTVGDQVPLELHWRCPSAGDSLWLAQGHQE